MRVVVAHSSTQTGLARGGGFLVKPSVAGVLRTTLLASR